MTVAGSGTNAAEPSAAPPRIGPLVAVLVMLAATTAALALAESIPEDDGLTFIDAPVAAWVLDHRGPVLTTLAQAWTLLGGTTVQVTITCLALGLLLLRGRRREAVVLLAGMLGSLTLTIVFKHVVARPRPPQEDMIGRIEHGFAFPSGHTLNSTVLFALLVWAFWPDLRTRGTRAAGLVGGLVIVLGIAASRAYLDVHWATDVVGAWLLATAWLSALAVFFSVTGIPPRSSPGPSGVQTRSGSAHRDQHGTGHDQGQPAQQARIDLLTEEDDRENHREDDPELVDRRDPGSLP